MQSIQDDLTLSLLAGWNQALAVFNAGDRTTKVCALSVMAVIVSKITVAEVQELLEDQLALCMAAAEPTVDELSTIRHFRSITTKAGALPFGI